MRGSQAVVEMLKAHQVRYIFGLPGDTSMPLYDALYRARGEVTHVLTRDERSASFMADVYARVSYRPGVCEAPSGAGATYLAPGVAEAHASSIPVIALTTDIPLSNEGKNVLTALNQEALFSPITKWRALVKKADLIPDIMRRAFRLATTGRPGAVQITLPNDVLDEELAHPALHGDDNCTVYPAYRIRPNGTVVRQAAELLLQAERPIIVAGGGVVSSQAWAELTALAEALSIPVGTTITGKGDIAEDHPLSIGVVGGNGGRDYANCLVQEADLILYVGCKTDSVTTVNWTLPAPEAGKTIIHLDVDPGEIGNNYPSAVGLVGDARLALADLLEAVQVRAGGSSALGQARRDEIEKLSRRWWSEAQEKMTSDSVPIKPLRVIKGLVDALPRDSIIVADAGTPTPFVAAYFVSRAGRQVIIPRGYGGLGYALPGVVGAKLAQPKAIVVGLMGDGSFGMSAGELETIARLKLPATIIQFNNACFGWIKALQELYHQGRYFSVDFSADTDHAAIARGFGLNGLRVEQPGHLEPAIRQALASDVATFIDVITESEETELPPVTKWVEAAKGRKQEKAELA
ncbi:MAG: thiamine pyrophosphate-binding protein [Chloroflexota bacterium]